MHYSLSKAEFLEKFAKEAELQGIIGQATDAILDGKDLLLPLDCLNTLYSRADFNEEAKFGF